MGGNVKVELFLLLGKRLPALVDLPNNVEVRGYLSQGRVEIVQNFELGVHAEPLIGESPDPLPSENVWSFVALYHGSGFFRIIYLAIKPLTRLLLDLRHDL